MRVRVADRGFCLAESDCYHGVSLILADGSEYWLSDVAVGSMRVFGNWSGVQDFSVVEVALDRLLHDLFFVVIVHCGGELKFLVFVEIIVLD